MAEKLFNALKAIETLASGAIKVDGLPAVKQRPYIQQECAITKKIISCI